MPFTPYHFGPSGFLGLLFRKWLDLPVLLLANVVVDIEVLVISWLNLGWPRHRYTHTLLLGAAAGIALGLAAFPFRRLFARLMNLARIPYNPRLWKMLLSGILGAWLHVAIDAIYHFDVRLLWPVKGKPFYGLLTHRQIKLGCVAFFVAALIPYIFAVRAYLKNRSAGGNLTGRQGTGKS